MNEYNELYCGIKARRTVYSVTVESGAMKHLPRALRPRTKISMQTPKCLMTNDYKQ